MTYSNIDDLLGLLRIPSHAGDSTAKLAAADYCENLLAGAGFRTKRAGNPNAPTLISTLDGNTPDRLLFYNHYDVLPIGDAAAWKTDAFMPMIADGTLYARGASDHKASFTARLAAVARLKRDGRLPVGITFLIDGEEEIGSPKLEDVIVANQNLLTASGGLYSGGARAEDDGMVIRAGCKGRVELILTVTTGDRDNHSKWAGLLPNPGWRLVAALSSLYDEASDKVLVGGFHEDATDANAHDREAMAALGFDRKAFLQSVGHSRLKPAAEADPLSSLMFSPTFNLAYLSSGSGGGTVLPGQAVAKLDIRLVPGQKPDRLAELVVAHLRQKGFGDIAVRRGGGSDPDKCDLDDPVNVALKSAAEEVSGSVALHPMGPGSGPRHLFRRYLGYSLVQDPGCSWAGSNDHGPNENIRLSHYFENCALIEGFLLQYGAAVSQATRRSSC